MPGKSPSFVTLSLWQMPQACTRMRTWPDPGCGISRSTISKSAPGFGTCTAFIFDIAVSPLLNPNSFFVQTCRSPIHQTAKCVRPLLHEAPDKLRNLICCGIEREMAGIEDVDFALRNVFALAFRFAAIQRELILHPISPAGAAASRASMPAISGRSPHWFSIMLGLFAPRDFSRVMVDSFA